MDIKAAILTDQKKNLEVDYINFEGDLKIGQVLVEVYVSGICGSQLK